MDGVALQIVLELELLSCIVATVSYLMGVEFACMLLLRLESLFVSTARWRLTSFTLSSSILFRVIFTVGVHMV